MYDFLLETLYAIYRNGFSLSALGAVVYVLAKQRKVKKRLRQFIPWLLEDDSEVKPYIENQKLIMANQKLIMERMGIECADTSTNYLRSETSQVKKQRGQSQLLITMFSIARSVGKLMKYGGKKMKNYLRKLGSRKFQSLLLSLIINAVSAYLFFSGVVEIDAILDAYMPMINLIVGTISTWLYIWVEGRIDAANVPPNVSQDQGIDYTQDTGL